MLDPSLALWSDSIDEFPAAGTAANKLAALVRFAVRAPSSHNSQPWLFKIVGETLELHADRTRRCPVVDPDDRELIISCGAALGYIEVTLHHFGFAGEVSLVAEGPQPDLLARITLGAEQVPTDGDHRLFAAISKRRTCREPFDSRTLDSGLIDELVAIARMSGVWFEVLQLESSREALAELITRGDRIQMANPAFRGELAAWIRSNHSSSRDGMPGYAHGLGDVKAMVAPLVIRTFDLGDGKAAHDRDIALGSPVLAVLGSDKETPADLINIGRVLVRILLRAAADGVSASFLNQPIEIHSLRRQVVSLLGRTSFPQLILRLGYPLKEGRSTPRRRPDEVLAHG